MIFPFNKLKVDLRKKLFRRARTIDVNNFHGDFVNQKIGINCRR